MVPSQKCLALALAALFGNDQMVVRVGPLDVAHSGLHNSPAAAGRFEEHKQHRVIANALQRREVGRV